MDTPSKDEIIQFIRKNTYIRPNTKLSTFKEINNQLQKMKQMQELRLTEEGVHHDDWPDDELLQQIEEYKEYIIPEIIREEENIKNARDVSIVARKGENPVPLDVEREIQSYLKRGGKMKKKSAKARKSRKSRKSKKHTRR
jgi:hypothetical protein